MRHAGGSLLMAAALGACAAAPVVPPSAAAPPAEPPHTVAGTRWVGPLEGRDDGHGTPRLEFAPGGVLHGYTGCNMLSGRWSENGGEVRFSALIVTKRYCLGPNAEVEKRLLAALSSESRATRQGARLVVVSPQGASFEFIAAAAA
jgi:heat shock protein HslJ